mgnify:CR=1 FL=1
MAAEKEVGKIYNSMEFRVDSKSWKNLDRFQKRIANVKKQLKSLSSEITVVAKVQDKFNRNQNKPTTGSGSPTGSNKPKHKPSAIEYSAMLKQNPYARGDALARAKAVEKARKKAAREEERRLKREESILKTRKDIARSAIFRGETLRSGKFVKRAGGSALSDHANAISELRNKFLSSNMTAREFRDRLARINTELKEAARNTKTWWERLKSAKTVMAGFAVAGAWQAGDAIMRTGQGFETMEAAMLKASGSLKQARIDLGFVRDISAEAGVNLKTATDGFTKLAVSAKGVMETSDVKALFEGYTKYAVSVGTDQFRYEKGLFALGQIMNKGTLMAEEVKNQLGEQVVGSMRVFSKALNMDTKGFLKAMEQGKLLSEDVLPLVAKQFKLSANEGGAYQKMIETNRVKMGQMQLQFKLWQQSMFEGGFKQGLNEMFDSLNELLRITKPLASAFGKLAEVLLTEISAVLDKINYSISFTKGVGKAIFGEDTKSTSKPEPIPIIDNEYFRKAFPFMKYIRDVPKSPESTTNVQVTVKDGEFSNAIEAQITNSAKSGNAELLSRYGG